MDIPWVKMSGIICFLLTLFLLDFVFCLSVKYMKQAFSKLQIKNAVQGLAPGKITLLQLLANWNYHHDDSFGFVKCLIRDTPLVWFSSSHTCVFLVSSVSGQSTLIFFCGLSFGSLTPHPPSPPWTGSVFYC